MNIIGYTTNKSTLMLQISVFFCLLTIVVFQRNINSLILLAMGVILCKSNSLNHFATKIIKSMRSKMK